MREQSRHNRVPFGHSNKLAAAILLGGVVACVPPPAPPPIPVPTVKPILVNAATTSPIDGYEVVYLNGRYSGCKNRTDDTAWSVQVTGTTTAIAFPYTPLTVQKDDKACVLKLTDVIMSSGPADALGVRYYSTRPDDAILDGYASTDIPLESSPKGSGVAPILWNIRLVQPDPTQRFHVDFSIDFKQKLNGVPVTVYPGYRSTTIPSIPPLNYGDLDVTTDRFVMAVDGSNKIVYLRGALRFTSSTPRTGNAWWVYAPAGILTPSGGTPNPITDMPYSYAYATSTSGSVENPITSLSELVIEPAMLDLAVGQTIPRTVDREVIIRYQDKSGIEIYEHIHLGFVTP